MDELEALLSNEGSQIHVRLLRRFACECCKRVSHLFSDPIYVRMLQFAERNVGVDPPDAELDAEYERLYNAMYQRFGTPSAAVLALVAVGEAARELALDAAIIVGGRPPDVQARRRGQQPPAPGPQSRRTPSGTAP